MGGQKDPFNRRSFPWGKEDLELLAHFRNLGQLRKNCEALRLGDIAFFKADDRRIGFTRSYFTTIFRKHTGVSPQEYLLQCRFKNGCRLLAETDYPVQRIAEQVGYEDPLAFSKAFKKIYKMSPTAYREQH
jgi:AraC-like DNA-binding protein